MLRVELDVDLADGEPDLVHRSTLALRQELAALEVDLEPAAGAGTGPTPAGARSVEALALGSLVLAAAPPVIEQLGSFLREWVQRRQERSVTIKVSRGDRSVEATFGAGTEQADVLRLVRDVDALLTS